MKTSHKFLILIGLIILESCANNPKILFFHTSHINNRADLPFSEVVETNGLLFLSGQLGLDHTTGKLVDGGVIAETEQAIKNIESVLAHHNSSLDKVVKCTVILDDINDFQDFNKVYKKYFILKPARTTFAAESLARNAAIEIEVIAVK